MILRRRKYSGKGDVDNEENCMRYFVGYFLAFSSECVIGRHLNCLYEDEKWLIYLKLF